MKTRRPLTLLLAAALLLLAAPAAAQTAKDILDKTAAKLRGSGGMQASFEATTFKGTTQTGTTTGSIFLQGQKFQIATPETAIWFDGKTQWTLLKGSNEVNVSNPTPEELQQMNPYVFVELYKKGYNLTLTEATYKGTACYEARLLAQNSNAAIQEMRVTISKTNYMPQSVRIRQGTNDWTRIRISALKTGRKWNEGFFRFNPQDHPGTEVIDLR